MDDPRFLVVYLPQYSPFVNPIEECFSAWRLMVHNPLSGIPLLQAIVDACANIAVEAFQGLDFRWISFYCLYCIFL